MGDDDACSGRRLELSFNLKMPFSLFGTWNNKAIPSSSSRTTGFRYCYTQFTVTSPTTITWKEICQVTADNNETIINEVQMNRLVVVGCGQNFQLGQSYGVFGGFIRNKTSNIGTSCVYFNRIDAAHLGYGNKNALLRIDALQIPFGTASCNFNGCPTYNDSLTQQFNVDKSNLLKLMSGEYLCANGVCLTIPSSSICTNNTLARDIGIGMSVGGIGLLLLTLFVILLINWIEITKKKQDKSNSQNGS